MDRLIPSSSGGVALHDVQHRLEGTCTSVAEIISSLGLDISEDELEDRLLDGQSPVEICGGCGWWHESGVLEFIDDNNAPYCADCLKDEEVDV